MDEGSVLGTRSTAACGALLLHASGLHLPTATLISYLPLRDVAALRRVCHSSSDAVRESPLPQLERVPADQLVEIPAHSLPSWRASYPYLRSAAITAGAHGQHSDACVPHLSGLARLFLYGSRNGMTDAGMRQLAAASPRLRTLHLRNAPAITDAGLGALAGSMDDLTLFGCDGITGSSVLGMHGLRSLSVSQCTMLRLSQAALAGDACGGAEGADAGDVTPSLTPSLTSSSLPVLPRLERLSVEDCSGVALADVEHMPSLKSLVWRNWMPGQCTVVPTLPPLLEQLSIEGSGAVPGLALQGLAHLQEVHLRGCDLPEGAFEGMAPVTHTVSVVRCGGLSDEGLRAWGGVRHATIDEPTGTRGAITDEGMGHLHSTQSLTLAGLKGITSAALMGKPSLTRLSMGDCPGVGDAALSSNPGLTKLVLRWMNGVTDSGLRALKSLRSLEIGDHHPALWKGLTARGVADLVRATAGGLKRLRVTRSDALLADLHSLLQLQAVEGRPGEFLVLGLKEQGLGRRLLALAGSISGAVGTGMGASGSSSSSSSKPVPVPGRAVKVGGR